MPETIQLREYETIEGVRLPDQAARLLGSSPALQVRPSTKGSDRWDVSACQFVGIIQAAGVEVRIVPKVPVSRLLFLLAYSRDPGGWKDVTAKLEAADDLIPTAAAGFVHQAERALARGVLQGYTVREEALPVIRGRLRTSDQMTRRFGLVVPIEVTYDDFTMDIPENRLLKSAGGCLLRLSGVPARVRRRLRRLLSSLGEVSELIPGRALPDVRFHRLNAHYRPVIRLAEIILQGSSLEFPGGTLDASVFLFDMNRVFEDFVTAVLTRAIAEAGLMPVAQETGHLDVGGAVPIRPDLVFRSAGRPVGVVDMKYKLVDTSAGSDVYQVLAYCTALGIRHGWLLHPGWQRSSYQIKNSSISVKRMSVDLEDAPERVLSQLEHLGRIMVQVTTDGEDLGTRTEAVLAS